MSACAAQCRLRPGTRACPVPGMSQWPQTLTSLRAVTEEAAQGDKTLPRGSWCPSSAQPPHHHHHHQGTGCSQMLARARLSSCDPPSAGGPDQQERHQNLSEMQVLRPVPLEQALRVGPVAFQQLGVRGLLAEAQGVVPPPPWEGSSAPAGWPQGTGSHSPGRRTSLRACRAGRRPWRSCRSSCRCTARP